MLAVDLSNYTNGDGTLTAEQAQALVSAGVRRAVVQLVSPNIIAHRQQIPVLLAAGIDVQAYVYVWFSEGEQFVRDRVAWACSELSGYPQVTQVWLDCEQTDQDSPPFDYKNAPTTDIIKAAVDTVEVRGYKAGIYSAKWWWGAGTTDSTAFSHLPLWDALYDGQQTLGAPGYGGWATQTMKQYAGTSTLAGVSGIDLNWDDEEPMNLPDATIPDVAAFWKAVAGGNQSPDVEITPIAPKRPGWHAFTVEIKEP